MFSWKDYFVQGLIMLNRYRFDKEGVDRILVVDDEPHILSSLAEFIASFGHEAMVARNGAEAKELLSRQAFALVVTDMKMPDINGLELMAYIINNYPATDVMVITSYPSTFSFTEVIDSGAIDYIVKPVNIDEFEAKLNRALRERRIIQGLEQQIQKRKEAEKNLLRVQDELEQRVDERTSELMIVNERLRREIHERKNIQLELEEYRINLERMVREQTVRLAAAKNKK